MQNYSEDHPEFLVDFRKCRTCRFAKFLKSDDYKIFINNVFRENQKIVTGEILPKRKTVSHNKQVYLPNLPKFAFANALSRFKSEFHLF